MTLIYLKRPCRIQVLLIFGAEPPELLRFPDDGRMLFPLKKSDMVPLKSREMVTH
jgi:hypothetical protein